MYEKTNLPYLPHLYNQQHLNKYSNRFKNNRGNLCKLHPPPPITRTYQQKVAKKLAAVLFKCKYDNNNIDIFFDSTIRSGYNIILRLDGYSQTYASPVLLRFSIQTVQYVVWAYRSKHVYNRSISDRMVRVKALFAAAALMHFLHV